MSAPRPIEIEVNYVMASVVWWDSFGVKRRCSLDYLPTLRRQMVAATEAMQDDGKSGI